MPLHYLVDADLLVSYYSLGAATLHPPAPALLRRMRWVDALRQANEDDN